jgi:hypothetical protein
MALEENAQEPGDLKAQPTGLRYAITSRSRMKDVIELLKTHMVDDMNVLKFVAEQLFGKAMQPITWFSGLWSC